MDALLGISLWFDDTLKPWLGGHASRGERRATGEVVARDRTLEAMIDDFGKAPKERVYWYE